jgi:hypothetical protein
LSELTRINLEQSSTSLLIPGLKAVEVLKQSEKIGIGLRLIIGMVGKGIVEKLEHICVQLESTLLFEGHLGLSLIICQIILLETGLHGVHLPIA